MNSQEALKIVEALVVSGKASRVSSADRTTKGIIFRTTSGRNFAVKLTDGIASSSVEPVRVVFERGPGGAVLDWKAASALFACEFSDRQFRSSSYETKGANLEAGKQMSVTVTNAKVMEDVLDWYADTAPLPMSSADRIRAHALSHYITPARERGDASVTLRAGTVHNDLGLSNNHANVYQALCGQIFLNLCALRGPVVNGPRDGATTTFTYFLEQ